MRRRLLAALLLALVTLAGSGCGGTPSARQRARESFLKGHESLHDDDLARLCPSLYPTDFLKDAKKYGYKPVKQPAKLTPADMTSAQSAGCTSTSTPPRAKP